MSALRVHVRKRINQDWVVGTSNRQCDVAIGLEEDGQCPIAVTRNAPSIPKIDGLATSTSKNMVGSSFFWLAPCTAAEAVELIQTHNRLGETVVDSDVDGIDSTPPAET